MLKVMRAFKAPKQLSYQHAKIRTFFIMASFFIFFLTEGSAEGQKGGAKEGSTTGLGVG